MRKNIIWVVGLPCAGKTTLAKELARQIEASVGPVEIVDGDCIRASALSFGLGFSAEDRFSNLMKMDYLAQRLSHYATVICAAIAPFKEHRQMLTKDLLVWLSTPQNVCEGRDVKGLWARARAGQIREFTGVSAPFEEPGADEGALVIDTTDRDVAECAKEVIERMFYIKGIPEWQI